MSLKTARALLLTSAAFALFGGGFWLHALLWTPRGAPPAKCSREARTLVP